MRGCSSLESVINMGSAANENGGSESMQESEATCKSAAELSTGSISFNSEVPREVKIDEEEDGEEDSHEKEDNQEEEYEEDSGEYSFNRRELSGLEPDRKRSEACLGTVEDEEEEINSRLEILQALVPGGYAMDTVSLLEQTACYIKLLGGLVNVAKEWS